MPVLLFLVSHFRRDRKFPSLFIHSTFRRPKTPHVWTNCCFWLVSEKIYLPHRSSSCTSPWWAFARASRIPGWSSSCRSLTYACVENLFVNILARRSRFVYSHECLVAAADLLDQNVVLRVDVRLDAAVRALHAGNRSAQQPDGVMQRALNVQLGDRLAVVTMPSFQHAWELLPVALNCKKNKLD